MRLIIIRHGDPIYDPDTLTEKGKREASILGKWLKKNFGDVKNIYVSPLGRAQETAKPIMDAYDLEAVTLPWLKEFGPFKGYMKGRIPAIYGCWDYLPKDMEAEKELYTEKWLELPQIANSKIPQTYKETIDGFDALLANHGYQKEGTYYKVIKPNHDTIVLVCHFGIECVLLSRLLNSSPWVFFQGTIAPTSSFTYLITEEREEGIASFRLQQFGDISHLREAGEEPSFSGRFVECFEDEGRH